MSSGFVVLYRASDLELIAACWPAATLGNTARAHWPEVRSRDQALQRANAAFGSVPGHLVLSYGEAAEQVREIVKRRRAKALARTRQLHHARKGHEKR